MNTEQKNIIAELVNSLTERILAIDAALIPDGTLRGENFVCVLKDATLGIGGDDKVFRLHPYGAAGTGVFHFTEANAKRVAHSWNTAPAVSVGCRVVVMHRLDALRALRNSLEGTLTIARAQARKLAA